MPVLISGILSDAAGKPVRDCMIQLRAKKTSPTVVVEVISSTFTGVDGHYSIQTEPGYYSVSLLREGFPPSVAGDIYVSPADAPDTLNAFLDAPKNADLRPEVMKRFEEMVNRTAALCEVVEDARDRAEKSATVSAENERATAENVLKSAEVLEEIRKLAPENYGKRFENFDDIVSRCTTAMLRLERPEVESSRIRLTVAENIHYDYTGAIHGQCDIAEPEQYRVEMYTYTTGEYFNGEASLEHDGTFYFKRSWEGAKQFRLIRKKDNSWITTLEFPLCIRSYWMAEEKDPDVVRVMKDRCYTYDQAVAALALMVQRHEATDRYVAGLCALVEPEGGVKFYVNRLSGQSPRAYYRMGNAAWVYYALAFYLEKYPDGVHASLVREKLTQGMRWLETFKVRIPGDLREGLYMGGRGKFHDGGASFDPDFIAEWCALEHNVDIWFLFELMGRTGFEGYTEKADALAEKIISGFWIESEGRFRQGVHPDRYDDAAALDQSSWGGTFIANFDQEKARRCQKYMSRFYYGTKETRGYTPYHPDYGYPGHRRGVWVEGTAGVALFERKMGNDQQAMDLIAAMAPLCNIYGYRDSCSDPSYDVLPAWPSTTNTAWVILVCIPDNFWLVNRPMMDVGFIEY
ncbi:TPA: prophage tail fiber N-terminal domain-containing protein [Citrobacter freundii]